MEIIKAGLKGLKAPDLVGKTAHVLESMTGNANFANPSPSLADVTAARAALVTAIAEAEGGAHAAIAVKNASAKALARLLTAMSRYVNSAAAGDVEKAVSSGFELAKTPDPVDRLDAPTRFEGRTAAIEGQVDLRWKGVNGGRMYFVYMSRNNGGTWEQVGMVSRGRFTVTGLTSGTLYSFRVTAVGKVGEGPLSETIVAKAA
ncbi:MAG: fibronectin type III domain-containing protein [Flavobacteriales bacterium]|nr:fibronectin type III domain-containing protein [Flavobacteriales bacterium]MBP6696055.1 fibronectin type III domain-containing protein [Flavobacteriales bacterium]